MNEKFVNFLESGIRNISQSFYDRFVEKNAKFRSEAGLKVTIVREALGECCSWCSDLEGVYSYDTAPDDIYARHRECNCVVSTKTEKGTWQDAHSKREYDTFRENRIAIEKELDAQIASRDPKKLERAIMERRKAPISDKNFQTYNYTKADSIRPKRIRNNLKKSDIGTNTVKYIEEEKVEIQLLYGVDNPHKAFGEYDPFDDVIRIYCDATKTVEETSKTVIHEVVHRQNRFKNITPFENEFQAFSAEAIHEYGTLTKEMEERIIKTIEEKYHYYRTK